MAATMFTMRKLYRCIETKYNSERAIISRQMQTPPCSTTKNSPALLSTDPLFLPKTSCDTANNSRSTRLNRGSHHALHCTGYNPTQPRSLPYVLPLLQISPPTTYTPTYPSTYISTYYISVCLADPTLRCGHLWTNTQTPGKGTHGRSSSFDVARFGQNLEI